MYIYLKVLSRPTEAKDGLSICASILKKWLFSISIYTIFIIIWSSITVTKMYVFFLIKNKIYASFFMVNEV